MKMGLYIGLLCLSGFLTVLLSDLLRQYAEETARLRDSEALKLDIEQRSK